MRHAHSIPPSRLPPHPSFRMFPALRPILNKGGAGRYISREESVQRLIPIAERQLRLLRTYDATRASIADAGIRAQVDAMMANLRTEMAKISETILSLGGVTPTGAGMGALTPDTHDSDRERIQSLLDAERDFSAALREETDAVHHQERSRAILGFNIEVSDKRTERLREIAADLSR